MTEESILKKIGRLCDSTRLASTLIGIGDDAAVIQASGRPLVFASDFSIEKIHFDFKFSTAEDVGHKSLARALSDIAAMGATPLAVTISIAIPKAYAESQIENFLEDYFKGAVAIAKEMQCAVAGGDLSRLEGPLVIDVAAVGELRPEAKPWRRSGATAGDQFYVSGDLGGAAFALEQFKLGRQENLSPLEAAKHLRPRPRFDVADNFTSSQMNDIKAAMDVSDGLIQDAFKMCLASGVSLLIDESALRISPGASIKHALTGGDDYELMLALPSASTLKVSGATKLGVFTECERSGESEVSLMQKNGGRTLLASSLRSPAGHDPFRDV